MTVSFNSFSHRLIGSSSITYGQATEMNNIGKNVKPVELGHQTIADAVGSLKEGRPPQKLEVSIVEKEVSTEKDYIDFFQSIIEDSKELSKEEKKNITAVVKEAVNKNGTFSHGVWTSDKGSMFDLQTREKLHLASRKYSSKFNERKNE